jgi:predicted metal-dependent hydrolase
MIPSNVFGYDGLNRVFIANYGLGDNRVTAFISRRASSLKAEQLALKYHKFLMSYDGIDTESEIGIKRARVVKISEAYEVIFTHGPYLAGVHEATDKEQAEYLAEILKKKLEEMPGKR